MKCPLDCTCYDCLAKMADPNCVDCRGDGYWMDLDKDILCPCTESERVRRSELADKKAKAKSSESRKS